VTEPVRPGALAFDVNETLLDYGALDPYFEEVFGDAAARREWFAIAVQAVFVTTVIGRYENFADLLDAALDALASRRRRPVGPGERDRLRELVASVPPHPDVAPALAALREHGYRLATLTNNPLDLIGAQLRNAGLTPLFDEVLSADEVRRLKPASEPYQHAADRMGVGLGELMLVAAHGWDCTGAQAAGAAAALVTRAGAAPFPVGPPPDLVVAGLAELVTELTA
jgi:2-haloacid dehalogenase